MWAAKVCHNSSGSSTCKADVGERDIMIYQKTDFGAQRMFRAQLKQTVARRSVYQVMPMKHYIIIIIIITLESIDV